jgi:hypothetical protein
MITAVINLDNNFGSISSARLSLPSNYGRAIKLKAGILPKNVTRGHIIFDAAPITPHYYACAHFTFFML